MSTIEKSISVTISMIVLVLSLAVVGPTTAMGKGNKRTGNQAWSNRPASRGSLNRVGGKMHLEDISLGYKGLRGTAGNHPVTVFSQGGNDAVTVNDFKRR